MTFQVDVQMTVREGGILMGDVLRSILDQEESGLEINLYVDASSDFPLKNHTDLMELLGESKNHRERFSIDIKAAYKRNQMLELGTSPYVYFADPDVLLPDQKVFLPMIKGLERHPRLGAIGLRCHHGNHVSLASMMLRRSDLYRIGKLRARQDTCTCNHITEKLAELGKFVVPLRGVQATHLDRKYKELDGKGNGGGLTQPSEYDEFKLRENGGRLEFDEPKQTQWDPIIKAHELQKDSVRQFAQERRRQAREKRKSEEQAKRSAERFTIRMPGHNDEEHSEMPDPKGNVRK